MRKTCAILFLFVLFLSCLNNSNLESKNKDNKSGITKGDGTYLSTDGKATLIISGNCRILKLNGSASERGYNYGYLLAAEIISTINKYSVFIAGSNYDTISNYQSYVFWENEYLDELNGMLDGIKSVLNLKQRLITPKDQTSRDITLNDLKMLNTIPDWGGYLCSSYSTWGNSTIDGSAIFARNLDYLSDPENLIKKRHLIISYNLPSGKKWVSVAFTGIIGCLTGMNEDGICGAMHNTNGYASSDTVGYYPRALVLRDIMQALTSNNNPSDVNSFLDNTPAFKGNNFHLCFSSLNRLDDNIASIIEYDGNANHTDGRATIRKPSDNSTLSFGQDLNFTNGIITTNHYLIRKNENTGESVTRYNTIKSLLMDAKSDGNVTIEESRNIMKSVGNKGTIQTVVFETNIKVLHIYLSEPDKGAFDCQRFDYNFNDLF